MAGHGVWVVTGASRGIGAAIARQLAAAGAAVCLAARRKGRIESLAGELSRAHGVPCEYVLLARGGHAFVARPQPWAECKAAAATWLRSWGLLSGTPV